MDRKRCRCGKGLQDLHRTVRRAVVDDHELMRSQGLRGQAIQLLLQEALPVERGHGYGNGGGRHEPDLRNGDEPRAEDRFCRSTSGISDTSSGGKPFPPAAGTITFNRSEELLRP